MREFLIETTTRPIDISIDPAILPPMGVCDEENSDYIAALFTSWLALLGDSPFSGPKQARTREVYRRFKRTLLEQPAKQTIIRFSQLFDRVATQPTLFGEGSITGVFLDQMRDTPVFREYLHWFRTGDPNFLTYILTFLSFGKKGEYVDESLEAAALRDWERVEERLSDLVLPDNVDDLRTVVRALLPPIDTTELWPKFGPGAVAERGVRGVVQKCHHIAYDPGIDRVFFWSKNSAGENTDRLVDWVIPDPKRWREARDRSRNVAKFEFVRKNVKTMRSIAMEPNTTMYFQQVVHDWLRASIDNGPLGDYIFLRDQTENQRAAVHGSTYGSVDTLDLSAASDSVSVDLVERVFPKEYLPYLLSVRTPHMETRNGHQYEVRKFAPMGSAVCFPVQCIVFAAVIVHSMMLHDRGTEPDVTQPLGLTTDDVKSFLRDKVCLKYGPNTPYNKWGRYETFRVFGDDLVVDSKVTDHVTSQLTLLGFRLNGDKSFVGSQAIRESCGIYAWGGHDVTPYLFKVKRWSKGFVNPEALASLVSATNNVGDRGLCNLHRFLTQLVLFSRIRKNQIFTKNPVRFVANREEFGIFHPKPRNEHLRTRRSALLQRDEMRELRVGIVKRWELHAEQRDAFDAYNYLTWRRARFFLGDEPGEFAPFGGRPIINGSRKYLPEEIGVVWGWTPGYR